MNSLKGLPNGNNRSFILGFGVSGFRGFGVSGLARLRFINNCISPLILGMYLLVLMNKWNCTFIYK